MIYANDNTGNKVHILDSDNNQIYFCINNCNDQVIPNKGHELPWFFKHKSNNNCNFIPDEGCVFYLNEFSDCKSSKICDKKCNYKN